MKHLNGCKTTLVLQSLGTLLPNQVFEKQSIRYPIFLSMQAQNIITVYLPLIGRVIVSNKAYITTVETGAVREKKCTNQPLHFNHALMDSCPSV